MQSKEELERWYNREDPWKYYSTDDDNLRKDRILHALLEYGPFERALDIGCGEGFITKDLPAKRIEGIEMSDAAASRLPGNIKRVHNPTGKYDLIVATGVLYKQYDWRRIIDVIIAYASNIVLTCNIKDWEVEAVKEIPGQLSESEFPYRDYVQKLRIFDVCTTFDRN